MAGLAWYQYASGRGFRWTPTNRHAHSGIDVQVPWGTPVTALLPGQVIFAGCKAWGGQVDLLTNYGSAPHVVTMLHLHSISARVGQIVPAGAILGYSGGDGRGPCPTQRQYSEGPHVHLELTVGSSGPYHGGSPYSINLSPEHGSYPTDPAPLLASLRSYGYGGGIAGYTDLAGLANTLAAQTGAAISFPALAALFALPEATVTALDAIPGVDNLIYRLHEAETFPGWKSIDQLAPVNSNAATAAALGAANASGIAAATVGVGGIIFGQAAQSAVKQLPGVSDLANPGRVLYYISGNLIANAKAAIVRSLFIAGGLMLLFALFIAFGQAQQQQIIEKALPIIEDIAPVAAAAA